MDKSGSFRVYMAITTQMAEDARLIHETSPLATHLLGRALTGTGLMGLMLREPGFKVTLQFKGDGPAQQVLCTASSDGAVKGYVVNPHVDLPSKSDGSPDVGGALGIGTLTCIRDTGLKEPYVGRIDLVSGEIADDMTAYFFISEQQQTSVSLGVELDSSGSVEAAGGMIIQMLPDASEEAIKALEEWLPKMPKITDLVSDVTRNADEKSVEDVMQELISRAFSGLPEEFSMSAMDLLDIGWKCDCSEERLGAGRSEPGKQRNPRHHSRGRQRRTDMPVLPQKYHFDKEHLERLLYESIKSKMN